MKHLVYVLCIASVILGLAWHLTRNRSTVSEANDSMKSVVGRAQKQKPSRASTVAQKSTTAKKECGCCRETLVQVKKLVKKRRQELEMWAREMVNTYGYEEGMKRVTAKSPVLAKRIQQLLEVEKGSQIPVASPLSAQ